MDGDVIGMRIKCPLHKSKDFQSMTLSSETAFKDAHTLFFGEYVHEPYPNVLSYLSEAVWGFMSDRQSIAAISAAERLGVECKEAIATTITPDVLASLTVATLRYNETLEDHGHFALNLLSTANHTVSDFPFLEALLAWRLGDGTEAVQLQKMRNAVRRLATDRPVYGETVGMLGAQFSIMEDRLGIRTVADHLRDPDFVEIEKTLRCSYVGGKHARYSDR
jgi:hypothetical protein